MPSEMRVGTVRCREMLRTLSSSLNLNEQDYGLATHTLGASMFVYHCKLLHDALAPLLPTEPPTLPTTSTTLLPPGPAPLSDPDTQQTLAESDPGTLSNLS